MALITAAGTSEILIFITPGCFLGLISSALIRSISSLSITAEHLVFVVYCVNEKLREIAHWLQLMWHDFPSMQVYSVIVLPCWSVWLHFDGPALQYGPSVKSNAIIFMNLNPSKPMTLGQYIPLSTYLLTYSMVQSPS